MSTSSSSDDYSNFQKYKKKYLKKKRKADSPKTSPKKFTSQFAYLNKMDNMNSSDEASEKEMTVEQMIEEQKKKKVVKEDVIVDLLDDSQNIDDDDIDKAGPSDRTRSQDKDKKKEIQKPKFQRKAQAILDEVLSLEREQKLEEQAHLNAVEYIANKVDSPIIVKKNTEQSVTIILGLMDDPEFKHRFNMKYIDRFDQVFLDYGAKAGYDKPEQLTLLWDTEDEYKTVKYFDTPQKLKMPLNGIVNLIFNPVKGAQRQKREEGEIKIKLNMKKQKNPLERIIHKEQPFGEFKIGLCAELKIAPSKVRFCFDGEKVDEDATPESLDMEEFDMMDMHVDD
jgi:hypothetical protein